MPEFTAPLLRRDLAGVGLLERDRELAALTGSLAVPGGAVTIVEGEAGIGKTRLLDAAAEEAARAGRRVLRAVGHELEEHFPLGVVHQLYDPPIRALPHGERDALFAGAAGLAAGAFGAGPPADPAGFEHGLHWVTLGLAERGPLALVIDDAHVADLASLRALGYLARRADDLGLAIVIGTRPAPATPSGDVLRRLAALPGVARIVPQPLSRGGVAWLLGEAGLAGADAAFVDACHDVTAGNPLYLRELLLVAAERGLRGASAETGTVRDLGPVAVAEAVYLTLERLAPGATDLARAAAVLGHGCALRDAAALAGVGDDEAVRLVSAMQREGLLAQGERLAFVHPVVESAIATELTAVERDHAHARAAAVLAAHGGSDQAVCSHLVRTGAPLEPSMVARLGAAAADAAAQGDHPTAVLLLTRALDATPAPEVHAELLAALAQAEAAAGLATAEGRFAAAVAVAEAGAARARLRLAHGRVQLQRGALVDAARTFELAVEELGDTADADAARLRDELRAAWANAVMWSSGGGGETFARARRTILAVREPSSAGQRIALAQLAGAMLMRGAERATALDLARRAWGGGAMLAELGPNDSAALTVSAILADADRIDEGLAVAEAIEQSARGLGLILPAATGAFVRGSYLMLLGRLAEAAEAVDLALRAAEDHGWGMYEPGTRWVASRVALLRGDLQAADAALAMTPEHERELAERVDYASVLLARADLATVRGAHGEALALLEAAGERGARLGACVGRYNWRPALVAARARTGDTAGARALGEENLALVTGWGAPFPIAAALRALAQAEPARRLTLLADAHDLMRTDRPPGEVSGEGIERARVALDLGRALLAHGDRPEAERALREALDQADRCGAAALVEQARAGLRELGARPRRARRTGADALTPGERRVARLAAAGRSNREIAEELFVTPKAVKWHLGNCYRKLEVSGRDELAAALGPRDEPEPAAEAPPP